jgi:prepilin-type N-terminal cleavage/methylation domain-containing protein
MKKAFTLIELLVALSLIGLLVSLIGPSGKRLYEKFGNRLESVEQETQKHDKEFQDFLEDTLFFESNKS